MKKWIVLCFAAALVLVLFPRASQAQDALPSRAELDEGWNQISPGGETTCAFGTPYSFFVRNTDSDKVLIHFQGGGACWDEETCNPDNSYFTRAVGDLEDGFYTEGIFDFDNPANPVGDYNMVVVSYCTADIHTGNQSVAYNDDWTIEHMGAVNSNVVLDWVFENYPDPEDVVITGCSAGAYGALYHSRTIMERYNDLRIRQLADSGVGIITSDWEGLTAWGTYNSLTGEFAEVAPSIDPADFNNALLMATAAEFPQNRFAHYTTNGDIVQTGFYFLMGGIGWTGQMNERLATLNDEVPNFASYIAGGDEHCVLPLAGFYEFASDGVPFVDWFGAYVAGEDVENVRCEDCETMEVLAPMESESAGE